MGAAKCNSQIRKVFDISAGTLYKHLRVLPRLPVIPGYNDSAEDAAGFVRRLREVGAGRVQLLPFHQFGENKYHMLGKEYAFAQAKALHPEDLQDFRQVFLANGMDAFF